MDPVPTKTALTGRRIFAFPHHRLLGVDVPCPCDKEYGGWSCVVCAGGLAICTVCNGAEGSLPTHCPGEDMHPEVADEVMEGSVDYDARLGWVERESRMWGVR